MKTTQWFNIYKYPAPSNTIFRGPPYETEQQAQAATISPSANDPLAYKLIGIECSILTIYEDDPTSTNLLQHPLII